MKWTTANVKCPDYKSQHEIFIGTQTGSFKKLSPTDQKNPFTQRNLIALTELDKDSRVTSLTFNADKTQILVGLAGSAASVFSLQTEAMQGNVELKGASAVVGLAQFDNQLAAGFANGKIQCLPFETGSTGDVGSGNELLSAGDEMAHLRQCATQPNLVATGGNGRQNNLKVFDMAAGGKQIFTSKNVPNDFLQLEVPVWDSDVGFIDEPHTLATCSRHGYVRVYDTRKQRRPVQLFATEEHMSFTTLAARGNYIYTGTTTGALKAFDIRRMKTFVHTYKGFTGGITDLYLDSSGKYLASSSLDRYARIHNVDTCVLMYQCYVKSKASRILIRETPPSASDNGEDEDEQVHSDEKSKANAKHQKRRAVVDEEYEDMFDNMQTICDNDEEDNNEVDDDNGDEVTVKTLNKRKKEHTKVNNNKKKKN